MAETFSWKEIYSVQVEAMDRQHQTLFSTINELNDALARGEGSKVVDRVLNKLVVYATTHFAAEEGLMEKHHFPGLAEHRARHQELRRRVDEFLQQHEAGKVGVPADLILFLQGWLREHILGTDHQYSGFLNAHGVH